MKFIIICIFVPNKHVTQLFKYIAKTALKLTKVAIKKAIKRLLNWLED